MLTVYLMLHVHLRYVALNCDTTGVYLLGRSRITTAGALPQLYVALD